MRRPLQGDRRVAGGVQGTRRWPTSFRLSIEWNVGLGTSAPRVSENRFLIRPPPSWCAPRVRGSHKATERVQPNRMLVTAMRKSKNTDAGEAVRHAAEWS